MNKEEINNLLKNFREQIDSIDGEIVYLLSRRLEIVKNIGNLKKENNIPALQKDRWENLLNNLKTDAKSRGLNPNLITEIWNLIHVESLKIEK